MSRKALLALVATVAIVAVGLSRLRLDVDLFTLLPKGIRMVEGVQLYQEGFGASRELMLTIRAADAETAADAARSLAERLEKDGLTEKAIWRSPLRDDPNDLGELLAFFWMSRPKEEFDRLASRFDDDAVQGVLADTLDELDYTFSPAEFARLQRDPFGLTRLPVDLPLESGPTDPFASPDGTFRILFAPAPGAQRGFLFDRRWSERAHEVVRSWSAARDDDVTVKVTGNPAFVAEFGSGLLRDVSLAALGTLLVVSTLFWLTHRRWAPLLWLVVLLGAVVVTTAGLGGLALGTLNAISLGFATILLGLAADYALILQQEFAAHPDRPLSAHRSAVAPSILWAAATTAGAFFMVARSSLPGLTQLGTLVALGILAAAAIMVSAFLPPLVRGQRSVLRPNDLPRLLAPSGRAAWTATGVLAAGAAVALVTTPPEVRPGADALGPREGRARAALAEVRGALEGFDESLWLVVSGRDFDEVGRRLRAAEEKVEHAVSAGLVDGMVSPGAWWPSDDARDANRDAASRLAERWASVRDAAREAGFTDEALALTRAAFRSWGALAGSPDAWPQSPGARWVLRRFAERDDGRVLALGRLEAAEGATSGDLLALAERVGEGEGTWLASWSLVSESLLGIMRRDLTRVLVPMAAVLLVLLGLTFRRPGEVLLSLATLGLSVASLLALMGVLGWTWDLMNVMALPLLLGASVDYSIHVQLALRREGGDIAAMRRTVGRAILLCGVSTAVGFGSLGFASIEGLASLGRVCAAGVLLACLISVLLLPIWWRALRPAPAPASGAPTGDSP